MKDLTKERFVHVFVRQSNAKAMDHLDELEVQRSVRSKNGSVIQEKPQYMDAVKSLPIPVPVAAQVVDSPDRKEDEGSVEHLSARELLQRHVKRAKRVRLLLKEERLQRITRYKTRLALLLPPMVEPHFKNESTAPN